MRLILSSIIRRRFARGCSGHSGFASTSSFARGGVFIAMLVLGSASVGANVSAERREADETFQAEMAALAAKCDEVGLEEQGRISRQWHIPRDPRRHYFFFPFEADLAEPPRGASQLVTYWHEKFMECRRQQAARLFDVARQAVEIGDEAAAYRLLHEVLHEDPAHQQARRILGYLEGRLGRYRPERRPNRGPHPLFGWPSDRYWQIESEHFRVTTNLNAHIGRDVARYLERVYAVWRQLFYQYWSVPGRLTARFRGEQRSLGPDHVFSVVLFRDRDEYVRQLGIAEPQIGISVGYYSRKHETAFFYAGDDTARTTWIHESTHQFFQENGTAVSLVGEQKNFWVVEGVALYMESLVDHVQYATTGGADAERLQFARFRKLSQKYYVPLAQLVSYGRERMQQDPKIRALYSQTAGLTHYLMHGADGRWMAPFMQYMKAVYSGMAQVETLARETGQQYERLDQGYCEYLNVTDADLGFVEPGVKKLCLAHTKVTDDGLATLPDVSELDWLDLSFTSISNEGFAHVAAARKLKQLNLEQTRITDDALDTIAGFKDLEELDLSQTAITDKGLKKLSRLGRLKILWLTGTQITNRGLSALTSLRNLELLDVQSTDVTPTAYDQLRRRLPDLR